MGSHHASDGSDNYTSYDRYIRQVRPWIITMQENPDADLQVRVLCMVPNEVLEASRKPEGGWPPSGAAGTKSMRMEMMLVVAVAIALVW